MNTARNPFNRILVVAGMVTVLMVVTLVSVLLTSDRSLAQDGGPAQAKTGAAQASTFSPPPRLDPPVQGPVLNRRPALSVDHEQLRRGINALEFESQLKVRLWDRPQLPADSIPPDVEKTSARGEHVAREMTGPQPDLPLATQANQLQAAGWTWRGSEDFEYVFGPGVSCGFGGESWRMLSSDPDYLWGDDSTRAWFGNWSAWPAAAGRLGLTLEPSIDGYPDDLNSWLVCGPFDFSSATDAFVDFGVWFDTELYFDWLWFGASVDNITYDVADFWSGYSGDWEYVPFWLTNYAGYSEVWLAWVFTSDISNPLFYEGAWVDTIDIWTYELPPIDDGNLVENGSFEDGIEPWWVFNFSVGLQSNASDVLFANRAAIDSLATAAPDQVLAPDESFRTDLTSVDGDWSVVMIDDGEVNDFLGIAVTVPMTTTDIGFGFWFAVTTDETRQDRDWFCASLTDEDFVLIVDLGCLDAVFATGVWQEVLYTLTDDEVQAAITAGTVNLVFELYNRGPTGTATWAWIDHVRLFATGAGTSLDDNEPNDSPGEATTIGCGDTVNGTIGDALVGYGDLDWFILENAPPGRIDVDISAETKSPPSALDSVVYLVDADGQTVLAWNDDDGATYDSYVVTTTLSTATFYVAVESYSGYGGPDSFYDLKVSCAGTGGGPPPPPDTPPGADDTWTLMLYLNAEDKNFERTLQQYIVDMQDVLLGKTDYMTVTVLYDGPNQGDTVRYLLRETGIYTDGVNRWPMNEQNMGDPDTLAAFADWSMDNYPAANYYLAVDDHGHGVYGISWDKTSGNDELTPPEFYSALKDATNNGARKIDILDYEACLMGMVEHAYDVREWVDYVVFFEQISWGINTYPNYFKDLLATDEPPTVGTRIINRYHAEADDQGYPHTISLISTAQMASVKQAVTDFGNALVATNDRDAVDNARNRSQAFAAADDATNAALADYIDLWHLASNTIDLSGVSVASEQVKTAVDNAVVTEQHSSGNVDGYFWDHSGVHGLSIYYPASNASGAFSDYIAERLFLMSRNENNIDGYWDEFLEWAVTTGGNGASDGIGGGDRKGMNGFRFLQPRLGGDTFIYLPLVVK